MDIINFEVNIPIDEDGYIEMECDFCKKRFMLHKETYFNEENLHFFCPICGLPNDTNTFYCTEIIENVETQAFNYMNEKIDKVLGGAIKKFNKNGFVKMSFNRPTKEPDKELYLPSNSYEFVGFDCCKERAKVENFDKEIGVYCPICGGFKL